MINKYLSELLDYAVENEMIEKVDEIYAVNRVLNLIGGDSFEREEYEKHNNIEEILSATFSVGWKCPVSSKHKILRLLA